MNPVLKKHKDCTLEAIVLYKEQLEKVVDLLKGAGLDTKYIEDDYEYENLEKITKRKGSNLSSLKIKAESDDGYIDICFRGYTTDLSVVSDHDKVKNAYFEIKELLEGHKQKYLPYIFNPFLSLFFLIFSVASIDIIHNSFYPVFFSIMLIINFIWSIIYQKSFKPARMIYKHEDSICKNRVKYIAGILFTALVGALFSYFVNKLEL